MKLHKKYTFLLNAHEALEARQDEKNEELRVLREQLFEIEKANKGLESQVAAAQTEKAQYEQERALIEDKVQQLTEKMRAVTEEREIIRASGEKAEGQCADLQERVAKEAARASELERDLATCSEELTAVRSAMQEKEEGMRALE